MAFELPYMPLWVVDIDTDRDCRAMTDAEIGRYMRLLFRQWMEGDVPTDATRAIRDAMLDPDAVESVQRLLDMKFSDRSGPDGRARNPRCHELREAAIAKAEVNRRNGSKGGRPKADANPTVNPSDNPTVKRIKRHSESESESESPPLPPTGGDVVSTLLGRMGVSEGERDSFASIDGMTPCHAVAVWRSVTADGNVKHVWRAVAGKLRKSGIDGLTAPDPDAVFAAVKAGIVQRIGNVDVTGKALKRNHLGVQLDGEYIATADELKSWAVALA